MYFALLIFFIGAPPSLMNVSWYAAPATESANVSFSVIAFALMFPNAEVATSLNVTVRVVASVYSSVNVALFVVANSITPQIHSSGTLYNSQLFCLLLENVGAFASNIVPRFVRNFITNIPLLPPVEYVVLPPVTVNFICLSDIFSIRLVPPSLNLYACWLPEKPSR